MEIAQIYPSVQNLVVEVGDWISGQQKLFSNSDIEEKGLNNLVSYVDKTAEQQLVSGLKLILPGSHFLTEEATIEHHPGGEWEWVIDPLDGTTNFLHRIPLYCVSVALRHDGEIVLGIIYVPNLQEIFHAVKGAGAYLNGQRIKVSEAPALSSALIATGFPHRNFEGMDAYIKALEYFFYNTQSLRRMGAAAIDLAYIACGRMDGFFELKLSPWDIAAGALLITEAGGMISDFNGSDDYLFKSELLAGNPVIYNEMREVLHRYFAI
ncbi:MAG: inositol monophosphatase [Saprospiraceae bacterium]|nr:inositol monophosphatase [Saprospiraceae bacterium]MBK6480282.1 inositol monophosphatase [Saprospiraceae bacterium]MBK6814864.1 inositol monophosphatase [Saprospiraceae bacterium]MBK7371901.1 inositol monophosphatase [Saprospiraceae bacterium]MBK7435631.1 inositol monophosphatase [Saprospiraceae bacterium]